MIDIMSTCINKLLRRFPDRTSLTGCLFEWAYPVSSLHLVFLDTVSSSSFPVFGNGYELGRYIYLLISVEIYQVWCENVFFIVLKVMTRCFMTGDTVVLRMFMDNQKCHLVTSQIINFQFFF